MRLLSLAKSEARAVWKQLPQREGREKALVRSLRMTFLRSFTSGSTDRADKSSWEVGTFNHSTDSGCRLLLKPRGKAKLLRRLRESF